MLFHFPLIVYYSGMTKKKTLQSKIQNNIIVKDNDLINSSYELTLNESRLLLACISLVDSRDGVNDKDLFKVEVKDIQDLCGVVHVGGFHRELVEASERLYEREISIGSKDSTEYGKTRWISKYLVDDMNRTIELQFTKDVLPYLTSLKKRFTKYKLEDVSKFSSVYSIRIYEQLAQWKTVGHCEITVEKLREILCLRGKYPKFNDLRRYVIEVATNEITEHSNLNVSYGYRKNGRTIVAIQFRFTSKEKVVEIDTKQLPNKKESIDQKGREQHSISQFKILEFVNKNPELTQGKTDEEVKAQMRSRDIKI